MCLETCMMFFYHETCRMSSVMKTFSILGSQDVMSHKGELGRLRDWPRCIQFDGRVQHYTFHMDIFSDTQL